MLIDTEVKKLVRRLEEGGNDADNNIRLLLGKLTEACRDIQAEERLKFAQIFNHDKSYPLDSEGYAVAFDPLQEEDNFIGAWERYGFVVGKNIASLEQCQQTAADIKTQFNAIGKGVCSLDQPGSWKNMPKDENGTPLLSRGFLEIYHDDALAQIRQNLRAYIQHVLIWGRTDLWTSFDRIGIKLPHHEESKALPLHVDQNPNIHPGFKTVQGVLALTDCPAERGTFLAVPASRNSFSHYGNMTTNNGEYVELNACSAIGRELTARAQPIPLRAGCLVSWDSRTTHANTENISDDARMVVYMAMGPAREDDPALVAARMDALRTGTGINVREALMHASRKPRFTDPLALAPVRQPERLTLLGKLLYGTQSYKTVIATPAA